MANRFPLIVDTNDSNKIKELPSGDNLDITGGGLTGASFISTDQLVVNGSTITPFTGSWNDLTDKPVIPTDVVQLADATNLLDHFSGSWNDLTDKPVIFSGSYTDLTNKPVVPTDVNQLGDVDNLLNTVTILDWSGVTSKPTTISGFGITDAYTQTETDALLDNKVDKNSTFIGDMRGSIIGEDSTIIVDSTSRTISASSVTADLFSGRLDGNIEGLVYGTDGTTILVDGNTNSIPQDILAKTSFVKAFGIIQSNGGGAPTIDSASYNLASVVRDSTGVYTITYTNPVDNGVPIVSARTTVAGNPLVASPFTTTSNDFVVKTFTAGNALSDNVTFSVLVLGV